MGEIAEGVKDIVKKSREELKGGESTLKIMFEVASSLFDLGRRTESKEPIIMSFLWTGVRIPLNAFIEHEVTKSFPKILEESMKGKNHELARRFLNFLSRKNLEDIMYRDLIDYKTGQINFEEVNNTFKIKSLELPMEEKGFIILTIAKGLEEAWRKAYMKANKLVKEHIDKLDNSLSSIESDKEVLDELKKVSEDILYELHLKALGGE